MVFLETSDSGFCPLVGRRQRSYRNLVGLANGSLVEVQKGEEEAAVEEEVGQLRH